MERIICTDSMLLTPRFSRILSFNERFSSINSVIVGTLHLIIIHYQNTFHFILEEAFIHTRYREPAYRDDGRITACPNEAYNSNKINNFVIAVSRCYSYQKYQSFYHINYTGY